MAALKPDGRARLAVAWCTGDVSGSHSAFWTRGSATRRSEHRSRRSGLRAAGRLKRRTLFLSFWDQGKLEVLEPVREGLLHVKPCRPGILSWRRRSGGASRGPQPRSVQLQPRGMQLRSVM